MKSNKIVYAVIASVVFATPVLAQQASKMTEDKATTESSSKPARMMREPIDLQKFSRTEELKAADTDGDGYLSRSEIEAHAMHKMVKRNADRMERRLDVNKDGKISLDAIEKHRAEKFAELDKNKDGQLDRKEIRAGMKRGDKHHGGKHAKGEHMQGDKMHGGKHKQQQMQNKG